MPFKLTLAKESMLVLGAEKPGDGFGFRYGWIQEFLEYYVRSVSCCLFVQVMLQAGLTTSRFSSPVLAEPSNISGATCNRRQSTAGCQLGLVFLLQLIGPLCELLSRSSGSRPGPFATGYQPSVFHYLSAGCQQDGVTQPTLLSL